jgi:hypothetical protein
MTPAAKPPVSATQVANFSTIFFSNVDTGGKFATGVNNTSGKFATSVNNTGRKFATGVNDAGGKWPSVSTTLAANFATGVNDTCGKQWEQLPNC